MPSSAAPYDLVFGIDRIDDLAADIGGDPDLVDLHVARRRNRRLDDFGKIAEMAEVEGHAHAGCLWAVHAWTSRTFPRPVRERHACGRYRKRRNGLPEGSGRTRGSPNSASRNSTGSLPAAWASSSMKDWKTKPSAFDLGARSGPVGTPSGISDMP